MLQSRHQIRIFLLCCVWSLSICSGTSAQLLVQNNPAITGGINAGNEERRLQKQLDLPDAIPVPAEKKKEDDGTPHATPGIKTTFSLKAVQFEGNQSVKTEALQQVVSGYLNTTVNFKTLEEMLSALKNHYRKNGLIAVYIYLPPQSLDDGTLDLNIVEGRLGEMHLKGNTHYKSKLLKKQFEIESGEVISYQNFEADLVRLNKNRNIKARAIFKKGQEFGTTDIDLNVEDTRKLHATATFGNFITQNIGMYRWGGGIDYDSPLGLMDHFSAQTVFGKDSWAIVGDYNVPIWKKGTRIGYRYSQSHVNVGGIFDALELEGRAKTHTAYLTQPLIEKENLSLGLNAGFEMKKVENEVFGNTFGKERLRILTAGLNLEKTWPKLRAVTMANVGVRIGMGNMFGGSSTSNDVIREASGNRYFTGQVNLQHYQHVYKGTILSLKARGQATPDRLPTAEETRLGGAYSVRGYQEGDFLADNSLITNVELQVPFYIFPKKWHLPWTQEALRKQFQLLAFTDYGVGSIVNPIGTEKTGKQLFGGGVGIKIRLYKKLYGRVEYAIPMLNNPSDNRNQAIYFNTAYEVF